MSEILLPILAGLTLGALHAFDADHVAAVSVFVSRNAELSRAVRFGIRWALGHTATLLVFGLTAMSLKLVITPLMETIAEVGVGIMLVVLGTWGMHHVVRRERIHIHRHVHDGMEHIHVHSHAGQNDHRHEHSMFLVGAAHGFAGTASVLVVIPVTIISSVLTASLYILLFGLGTMVAMATFAYLLGNMVLAVKGRSRLAWLQGLAGMASIVVGCFWILERIV
jgi:hypothetical protein